MVQTDSTIQVFFDDIRGHQHLVGHLLMIGKRIAFEYNNDFLAAGIDISPYNLPLKMGIQQLSPKVFLGLPGVFNDSLPDGWGLLLMDRYFRSQKIDLMSITPLMRLAFVGQRAMGALTYQPAEPLDAPEQTLPLTQLANHAMQVFNGDIETVLPALLIAGGSPAGARPKILADINFKTQKIIYGLQTPQEDFTPYLIKFHTPHDEIGRASCRERV